MRSKRGPLLYSSGPLRVCLIPRMRVSIVGTSCSGKSTLARCLAQKCRIKYIEQDRLFWRPGWIQTDREEFRANLLNEIQADDWTICGNHSACRDDVWSRSTHIIWLNYSFPTIFYRALKRTIKRVFWREECCNGNHEGFRHAFLSTDSILWWVIKTYRLRKRQYAALKDNPQFRHVQFIEFRNPKEAERWLHSFDYNPPPLN